MATQRLSSEALTKRAKQNILKVMGGYVATAAEEDPDPEQILKMGWLLVSAGRDLKKARQLTIDAEITAVYDEALAMNTQSLEIVEYPNGVAQSDEIATMTVKATPNTDVRVVCQEHHYQVALSTTGLDGFAELNFNVPIRQPDMNGAEYTWLVTDGKTELPFTIFVMALTGTPPADLVVDAPPPDDEPETPPEGDPPPADQPLDLEPEAEAELPPADQPLDLEPEAEAELPPADQPPAEAPAPEAT